MSRELTGVTKATITIEWKCEFGQGSKSFSNVFELAHFLREQPGLATEVGYTQKKTQS